MKRFVSIALAACFALTSCSSLIDAMADSAADAFFAESKGGKSETPTKDAPPATAAVSYTHLTLPTN